MLRFESEKQTAVLKPSLPTHKTMKHLSDLSDDLLIHILSFLPTRLAARTSVLSRRFRHLWEISPVIELDHKIPVISYSYPTFVNVSERCLLHRNPPSSLRHLQLFLPLQWSYYEKVSSIEYISSLLIKARSLRLRQLTIQANTEYMEVLFPIILSTPSLEILSLINLYTITDSMLSPLCISNNIRSMSIKLSCSSDARELNRLVSKLHVLEDLELLVYTKLDLCSHTVKKLKVKGLNQCSKVRLSIPSLESLDFYSGCELRKFRAELPLLKIAVINVTCFDSDHVVCNMLKTFANVEHLNLDIFEDWSESYQFHTLVKPGKDPPKFPNLKHIHLTAEFHDYILEDLGTLLKSSPVVQSLKLNLELSEIIDTKEILWRPDYSGDNYICRYFNNLHIKAEKLKLLKQLEQEAIRFKTMLKQLR